MLGHGERPIAPPRLAVIRRAFDPRRPGAIGLDRRRRENVAVGELDRLVLDRSEQTGRKDLRVAERLARVGRALHKPRPTLGARPGFVEQKHLLGAAAEQHRVPARLPLLFSGNLWFRPRLAIEARSPDLDVARALALPAKPRRQKVALV